MNDASKMPYESKSQTPRRITVAVPEGWFRQIMRMTIEAENQRKTGIILGGFDWQSAAGGRMVFAQFYDGGELRIIEEDK